ncbi:MAG: hypothetical protein WCW87_03650 [Candidatus Paceibacterota bacterium]
MNNWLFVFLSAFFVTVITLAIKTYRDKKEKLIRIAEKRWLQARSERLEREKTLNSYSEEYKELLENELNLYLYFCELVKNCLNLNSEYLAFMADRLYPEESKRIEHDHES